MNEKKELESYCDTLYSKLYEGKKCYYCNNIKEENHHIIRRHHKIYRWNIDNCLPVCKLCHIKIHQFNSLKEPTIEFIDISYKDYLIKNYLSEIDFLNIKKAELEKILNITDGNKPKSYKKKKLSETKGYKESKERLKEYNKKLYQLKKQYKKLIPK